MPVVVLGNHCDETTERQVKVAEAKRWCRERYLPLFEVSAATGHNLSQALDALCVVHRRAKDGYPLRTRMRALSDSESHSVSEKSHTKPPAKSTPKEDRAAKVAKKPTGAEEDKETVSSQEDEEEDDDDEEEAPQAKRFAKAKESPLAASSPGSSKKYSTDSKKT